MTPTTSSIFNLPLPSGFRDFLPGDMIVRQQMFDKIRATFERFGYIPLDTPCVERREILTGKDPNFSMSIFPVLLKAHGEYALRYDLTVPLARVIASPAYRNDIQLPLRRYQTGKVFRGERKQAGRYNEFTQFDADVVGLWDMRADSEILSLMYETMVALGFGGKCVIRVNNRKILDGLPEFAGFDPAKIKLVLKVLDKLDKQGWDLVEEELRTQAVFEEEGSDDEDEGNAPPKKVARRQPIELDSEQVARIKQFVEIVGDQEQVLDQVEALMAISDSAQLGVAELREVITSIRDYGVPDSAWKIDLSIARGLDYYTGPIFETQLTDLPSIGSVFSGGRYDKLVGKFCGEDVPAVGASVGVDRLLDAIEKLQTERASATSVDVMVLTFDPATMTACRRVAGNLRRAGFRVELYCGNERSLKRQIGAASDRNVPYVVIIGGNEAARGVVSLKNLAERKQFEVFEGDLVRTLLATFRR